MRRRSLKELEQSVAATLAQCRRTIRDVVRPRINGYATIIGLQSTDQLEQFEQDLIEALLWCLVVHLDSPNRKRTSEIRKELLRVRREATTAEKALDRLRTALSELTPQYGELLHQHLELNEKIAVSLVAKQAPWFHALSLVGGVAGIYAERLKCADKGGAPRMLAFSTLVRGLQRAFQRATGRAAKVTWNDYRRGYEGRFISLEEAVLPVALELAPKEQPMRHPSSPLARGKYIHGATRGKPRRR